jgi:hypothetical protein
MSFKTKQDAFAAMQAALATIQKFNAPLPPVAMVLVNNCVKIVAANTKVDAIATKSAPQAMDLPPTLQEILEELKRLRDKITSLLKEDKLESAKSFKEDLDAYFSEHQETLKKGGKDKEESEAIKKIAEAIAEKAKKPDDKELGEIIKKLRAYRSKLKELKKELDKNPSDEKLQKEFEATKNKAIGFQEAQESKIATATDDKKELINEIASDIEEAEISKIPTPEIKELQWSYQVSGSCKKDNISVVFPVTLRIKKQKNGWQFVSTASAPISSGSVKDKEGMGSRKNVADCEVSADNKSDINSNQVTLNIVVQRNAAKTTGFDILGAIGSTIKPAPADTSQTNPALFDIADQYVVDVEQLPETIKNSLTEKIDPAEKTQVAATFTIQGDTITVKIVGDVTSLGYKKTTYAQKYDASISIP